MLQRLRGIVLGLILLSGGPLWARSLVVVTPNSPWTLRELESLGLDLVSVEPETGAIFLTVSSAEEALLVQRGYAVATVALDADAGRHRLLQIPDLGLYHTYAETVAELQALHAAYPDLTRLETLGQSLEGRDILALKISDAPDVDDAGEPDVLVVGNHHAREFMSVEVPLHFARTLLERYAANPRLAALVDERETWIVPILNPDGHVFQGETQFRPGWRKNRRVLDGEVVGVDLNRNYSYLWGYDDEGSTPEPLGETYRGTAAFSEPETRSLRALVQRQDFRIALSYHSFGQLVLYPWGWTRAEATPDDALFATLADSMVRENGYRPGNARSGAIYLTNGVWDDYMYGEVNAAKPHRTFAFTVELNSTTEGGFWPAEELIQPTCEAMLPLNLFALRVAADVFAVLPPPVPVLTALQDPDSPQRIELRWQVGGRSEQVDFYAVFEIDPAGVEASWRVARAVQLQRAGREILAAGVRLDTSGRVVVNLETDLEAPWERASLEIRRSGEAAWHELPARGPGLPLSGRRPLRRLDFDGRAWAGQEVALALRLHTRADMPRSPHVVAKLDVPAMLDESRRVLAVVRDTTYTVVAERSGLFAYGVTAVDHSGQRRDSDIYWFVVPERVAVGAREPTLTLQGELASLAWDAESAGRFVVWSRPLLTREAPGDAWHEWSTGRYAPVAELETPAPGRQTLAWRLDAGRAAVLLQAASTGSLWGPWTLARTPRILLHAAVPNPFNPRTLLRLETDGSALSSLVIVRPDGKRVRQLLVAALPAGVHQVLWDGRDDAGRSVASGVYLAWLHVGREARSVRLVLLR